MGIRIRGFYSEMSPTISLIKEFCYVFITIYYMMQMQILYQFYIKNK